MSGGGDDRIGDRDLSWQEILGYGAIVVVAFAVFPRLMRWSLGPTRLGPRGLAAYIAGNTALHFALRTWALPYLKEHAQARERARTALAQTLGREPSTRELLEHLGLTCTR